MVIAPANTGRDNNNNTAVIRTAQTNKGNLRKYIPGHRIFIIVTIKLIAPAIEEIPAMCKLKIAKSTAHPEWAKIELRGGYTVQPVPTPFSTRLDINNKQIEGGNNQKDILFKRGKAISGLPIKIGTNQLPKAPINIGITMKKIIIKACAVTITLYNCVFPSNNKLPGLINSHRINIDSHNPAIPLAIPKIKYKIPISL
jgi:hypothetical protein